MKNCLIVALSLLLIACNKKDINTVPDTLSQNPSVQEFGKRYIVTGDFNGDGVTDTIRESYISQVSNKETPKVRNVEDPSMNRRLIAIAKPKSLLRFSIREMEPYVVAIEEDQSGIYNLANIGDINNDGRDEFGFKIKWESAHNEQYRNNYFLVHTIHKGKVKQLYGIGGLSTDRFKMAEVKERINHIHDFEKFFTKIKADTVYQRERVKYPLNVLWKGFQENDTTVYVQKHEYSDIGYDEPHFYVSIFSPDEDTVMINLQMEDSGVSIDYYYKQDQDGWYLDHTEDYSD